MIAHRESVLIVAPHPDDESIGCGGTAALLVHQGIDVHVLFLTSGEGSDRATDPQAVWAIREAEAAEAAGVLGVHVAGFARLRDGHVGDSVHAASIAVAHRIGGREYSRVYLPHPDEEHPDHAACLPILAGTYRYLKWDEPWLLGYEVWTPMSRYDTVEDVSAVFDRKLTAIRAHRSQLKQFAYDRAAEGLGMYRGATAGHCPFAEVFQSLTFL